MTVKAARAHVDIVWWSHAGRPVDVEVSKMGLFISDDKGGAVYRVAYNLSFDAAVAALASQSVNPYEAGPVG